MKKLAIIGSGDLGQLIAHHVKNEYEIVGFLDDFAEANSFVNGIKVLGPLNAIENLSKDSVFDEIIIAIGYKHFNFRTELYSKLSKTYSFATIIHPSCYIDPSVSIGKGTCLLPGSVIDCNSIIEDNVLVNVGCTIAHDSLVKAHTFLSPSVAVAGFVEIGERCNIGVNSTIIDNIKIGDDIQIGGGTVVISNLETKGLYVGNPARFIR